MTSTLPASSSTAATRTGRSPIFYGWWIVLVSVLLMATIFGTIINSFSLFIKPVIADLPTITIAAFTLAYTVITLLMIPLAPIVGNLLKKWDARWIVSAGIVSAGIVSAALANVGLSRADGLTWIYIMAVLQGAAIALATTIPISAMITNWFQRHRGLALGIATAGSGLGSLIFVPLTNFTLIPRLGWRGAYLALAAIQIVLLLPLAILVLRNRPEGKGLVPLGSDELTAGHPTVERVGLTQAEALRTPAFWLLALALVFSGISVNGMISNFAPLLGSLQASPAIVAYTLGSLGIWVMISKFLTGWLYDRLWLLIAIALVSLANAAQFFFMLNPTTTLKATLFNILHGFGATMVTVTPAYLAGKLFGDRDYSAIYGWVTIPTGLGAALAPIFGGFFYGGKTTSDQSHAQTLIWAWLILGLIGFAFYIVTVKMRPKLPAQS